MNEKQFRIGNYILVNGEIQQICELPLPENCKGNIEPIELTKEWLIKFRLILNINNNQSYNHLFDFGNEFKCWYNVYGRNEISIEQYSEGTFELEHIKYVHQFQNLYFALKNEELKINI